MKTITMNTENPIIKILMERDGDTLEEAIERLEEARQLCIDGEDPEEVLHNELGLEPDYVFDLFEDPKGPHRPDGFTW